MLHTLARHSREHATQSNHATHATNASTLPTPTMLATQARHQS